MKKLFFTLMLLVAATATMSAYDFEVNGIYYNKKDSVEATVVRGNGYSGNVEIPEFVTYNGATYTVTAIGNSAFYWCSGLTSISIPNSVTSIGDRAFYYCRGLTSVSIGNSVESIGDYAFTDCISLITVEIPNSVTTIGYLAFYFCSSLTSVSIGNSVESIGDYAFTYCSSLTSINIPNSVTSIGDRAFYGCCQNLTSITVASGNSNYDSRDNCNAIIETATNELIIGCMNTTIPESVTSIGSSAFSDCTALTSIAIPNSVEYIGDYAFTDCISLTTVEIPNSIRYICDGTFYGCTNLTSIDIPGSVIYIGREAFAYSGLTSIVIPSSVEYIDEGAFNCHSLETVKCLGTEPPCAFDYSYENPNNSNCCFSEQTHRNATLIVPRNCEEAYLTDNCWCMFDHIESWGSAGPGDVDSDGRLNISDVTALIDILLSGETSNMEADVDGDGLVNIADVTVLIDKLLNNEQPNEPYETPVPELTIVTDTVAEVVTMKATGEGTIIIYVLYFGNYFPQAVAIGDGEATFVIPFGDWVTSVHVRATAQADDDALVGIGDLEYVRIPAKQVDPGSDDDSHNTGYWLVMVQDSGAKDYVQLQQGANGDYVCIYDVVYPPYYNIGNFYFLINGVPYGAPVDGTEAYVGDAMMNPLFANSSNTYYVYSGYSYTIGVHIVLDEATGAVAGYTVYAAKGGPV